LNFFKLQSPEELIIFSDASRFC